jgi:hypothetical protein
MKLPNLNPQQKLQLLLPMPQSMKNPLQSQLKWLNQAKKQQKFQLLQQHQRLKYKSQQMFTTAKCLPSKNNVMLPSKFASSSSLL